MAHLAEIDWRKTNPDWQGICMLGSDIITRRQTRTATSMFIQWKLGIWTRSLPTCSGSRSRSPSRNARAPLARTNGSTGLEYWGSSPDQSRKYKIGYSPS